MKIKGIHRDGAHAGEVIELSAEEKVPLTLQEALSKHKDFDRKYVAWFTDLTISSVNFFSKGTPLKNKWQNNLYKATGSATIHLRELNPDRLRPPKKRNFSLEFEDCVDPIGQPDTKALKLVLE